MSRRLVKDSSSSARRTENATTTPSMPPYQPPTFPLSDEARRAFSSISGSNELAGAYENQLAKSLKHLPGAVAAVNDRLKARRDDVDAAARRRRNQGTEPTPDDEEVEDALRRLERAVPALARELEAADRAAIDAKRALFDLKAALREVNVTVQQAQPRHQQQQGAGGSDVTTRFEDVEDVDAFLATMHADGEEEENEDQMGRNGPPGPLKLYRETRANLAAEYAALPAFSKYAENNDYIALKRHWHDGLHPNEDKPMPDASRWFDEDGKPRLDEEDGGGSDDDEIAYGPAVTSTRCPITLLPFQAPITSRKCKHTFEKSAIVSMFSGQGEKDCPMGGCVKKLVFSDFHEDPIMMRKIERARQQEARGAESEGEDDDGMADEEADASMVQTGARNTGRVIKREIRR